jgi:two-component system response regulator MtrA
LEPPAVNSPPKEESGPLVLICEDDPPLREFLRVALDGDFRFAETGDGLEAVELTRALRPDVVLLDVMLPGQSGLEALGAIRADEELKDTRVIVMTAFSDVRSSDVEAAGADRFLSKPFDPLELVQAVEDLLARGR